MSSDPDSDFILRRTQFPHLNDHQFAYVKQLCSRRGLDPWLGHVHAELRAENGRCKVILITTVQAFRDIAETTGEFKGRVGPQWCGPDGNWRDVWLEGTPPVAARVGINRIGRDTCWAVANWDSYAQWKIDAGGKLIIDEFWGKMGPMMLGKCAEVAAYRAAFSQRCGQLYIQEEIPRQTAAAPEPTTAIEDDAPPSEFLFQLRLVRNFELANPTERQAAIDRMREKFPTLEGPAFYGAALRALEDERAVAS